MNDLEKYPIINNLEEKKLVNKALKDQPITNDEEPIINNEQPQSNTNLTMINNILQQQINDNLKESLSNDILQQSMINNILQ